MKNVNEPFNKMMNHSRKLQQIEREKEERRERSDDQREKRQARLQYWAIAAVAYTMIMTFMFTLANQASNIVWPILSVVVLIISLAFLIFLFLITTR